MSHLLLMLVIAVQATEAGVAFGQTIPLKEGLTLVDSYEDKRGDFETIITVTHRTISEISLAASSDEIAGTCSRTAGSKRHSWGLRNVARADLENAVLYKQEWTACPSVPQNDPGMTAISVSSRVLRELVGRGETSLTTDTSSRGMVQGLLTRIDQSAAPLSVIVNDRPQPLATVHARWHSVVGDREYWILNDPANPLILRVTYLGRPILQVVKISFPEDQPPALRVQQQLRSEGRATLYGLCFDSGSDRLRDEAAPVLSDIARVLEQNTNWSLLIEGHTDSIGGDATNLDLSTRRAEAVKKELVAKYHVAPSRLKVAGFGARRPRDTNGTLEGRARNRRVELVREKG